MTRRPTPLDDALSRRMSQVRRRDTQPELRLRTALHNRGLRYRVDVAPLPGMRGRADLVFRSSRVAVYVDGCFWHGCPEHGTMPTNNREWWREKLATNRARDDRADELLEASGWVSIRVWEHEEPSAAADRVEAIVRARRGSAKKPET